MRLLMLSLSGASLMLAASTSSSSGPTFNKDVLPILQANCQTCHRPGEVAPMSFLNYEETRPWAKAIKSAILAKKMPPWDADPHFGKFSNERILSPKDIATLVAWADAGAKEGDPKDAPKPIKWVEGWAIGTPDTVLTIPAAYEIPAKGVIEYTYIIIPTGFIEDKWVQMIEVRPGSRTHVHHIGAFVREPGDPYLRDVQPSQPGVPFVPAGFSDHLSATSNRGSGGGELLGWYLPGKSPDKMPPGQARLIKAGSDIVLQMHYITDGTPTSDRSSVGIVFAKQAPTGRVVSLNSSTSPRDFAIPPGDPNYEMTSAVELERDVTVLDLYPHMHVRGKDIKFSVIYPTGEEETLLSIPKYNFNWQMVHQLEKPKVLPKGTRFVCTAHFDNSANNPFNPDPKRTVPYGDQTFDEMKVCWFDAVIPVNVPTRGVTKFLNLSEIGSLR